MTAPTVHERHRPFVPSPAAPRPHVPGHRVLRLHAGTGAADEATRWLRAACRGFDDEAVHEAGCVLGALVGSVSGRGGAMVTIAVERGPDALAFAVVDDTAPHRVSAFRVATRVSVTSAG